MSRSTHLLAVFVLVGCESNFVTNEPLPSVAEDAGSKKDASKSARKDAEPDEETDQETDQENNEGEQAPPDEVKDAGSEMTEQDAAPVVEADAGAMVDPPMESVIKGSGIAAKCSSYGLPKNGMCAGYYCGIKVDAVMAEYKPAASKCDTTPEEICDGQLTRDVAKCARDTKSNPLNALDSDEMIRAKVQTCVTKIAANKDIEQDCLDCFLDAAQCASDNCLTQCLTGDSATCDKCRMDNDCNQSVPTCAGLPSPF